ncbi:portal protein [Sphingomonas sp. GB1N7]|uniref:portal protein n=1 Tax=Parasphingomonas caseinilytica TaxID=3096158 RepID=UPI002FC5B2BE
MEEQPNTEVIADTYKAPYSHSKLKSMVQGFLDSARQNANLSKRDRRYFDGDQISPEMKATLAKRGQPPHPNNKIAPAINGLFGLVDAASSDPEAFPRTPKSQDAADVATKTLRYLAERANWQTTRRKSSENFLIEGTCSAILEFAGDHVTASRIRWEDFIYDPLSSEHDFEDAKFLGLGKLVEATDVEAMFPEAYLALGSPKTGDLASFFDEDNKQKWWSSPKRDRLRVVDLYYEIAGDWHRAIFCDAGMLYAGESVYHDDYGQTFCPITAASFETRPDGDRYGPIRNMVPLQDSVNARSSRLLHLVNHRQMQQTDLYAPAANKDIARREGGKADGVIPFGYSPIQAPDLAQGQMLILQQSMADLDRMAPTPAVLGRSSGAGESGRARQILQQAGGTEIARGFSRFEDFELTIYRKMWWIAKEHLDQPTIIRIADDPKAIEFLTVNEPVMGPVQQPVIDPSTGQPAVDPATGQPMMRAGMGVVEMKNRLAELDLDIILSTTPDTISLQHEISQQIMEYASATKTPISSPEFLLILEMSQLPNKRETIDRIKRLAAEQQQAGGEEQTAAAQMQMQAAQTDIEVKKAKIAKDSAHAAKAGAEAERTDLETQALVGMHLATQPQQPPAY